MDKEVIEIIEKNADLINANKWDEIYRIFIEDAEDYETIGAFTEAILSARINILEYLDYIPAGFLCEPTITDIHIPKHITGIGSYAFRNSRIENITFAENSQLASIGDYAFENAKNLKRIVIPSSVTSIGDSAFYNARKLETVIFAEGSQLTSIDSYAFYNASSLKSIVIPASVTNIGSYAFAVAGNVIIYTEAESQPAGWDDKWNPSNRPVIWGYKEK